MPTLSLALLGPVQVALDNCPLRFRTNKAQGLLVYLAVEAVARPAAPHRREALMELLWPGLPLQSAQDNLRQTLYQLRKTIPVLPATGGDELVPLLLTDRRELGEEVFQEAWQLGQAMTIQDAVAFALSEERFRE